MSFISNILESTKQLDAREKTLLTFFASAAVSLTFLPHFSEFSRQTKTLSLAGGIFSSCSYLGLVATRKNKSKIIAALEAARLQGIKESLSDQITQEAIDRKILAKQSLKQLVTSLPVEEQTFWIQKYELQGLIAPEYEPEEEYNAIMDKPTVTPQASFDEVYSARTQIDYSWLNEDFFLSPQVMVGSSGSGKTSLMSLVAKWFVTEKPEGELRIGDLHYDSKLSKWLPGIPPKELLRKYLVDDTDSIVNLLYYAEKVLDERIDKRQQGSPPLKILIDEFVGFMNRLDKKLKERMISIIKKINFEGRKYGVTLCLGLHSTKKEETGLDSSVISNFFQLWLKDSIDDVTVAFSRSFNFEELIAERDQLRAELKKGEGYPAVLKPRGEKPRVVILPHIHDEDLQVIYDQPKEKTSDKPPSQTEKTAYEEPEKTEEKPSKKYPVIELFQWYLSFSSPPLDSAIREKWHELTGVWLTDQGLSLVKEKLIEEINKRNP